MNICHGNIRHWGCEGKDIIKNQKVRCQLTYMNIWVSCARAHESVNDEPASSRRDRVPYAVLYITPILVATRLHSTRVRGQFFTRLICRVTVSIREHFTYTRISRSAYGVGILIVTCLHTSDERYAILCTSCVRILYNAPTDLHTEDRQDRYTLL